MDSYYSRPEVSNSDLSALKKLLNPGFDFDFEDALRMGTLVDAMITEMAKVNLYKRTCEDYSYNEAEMNLAREMKKAFYRDQMCDMFMKHAECQKVSVGPVGFTHAGLSFELTMRCKWDIFMKALKMGADIKSTTATTQQQFEDACWHFDYFRSRVIYMLLENTQKDMLIGISKVNLKVFKIPIVRGDKYWTAGLAQASELAFTYWNLFENFNPLTIIK